MAQKKTTKGALTKDPSVKTPAPFDAARASTRVRYLERVRPNDPEIKRLKGQIKKSGYVAKSVETPPPPPSQEERVAQAGGDVFEQMSGYAKQFDPRTFQSQYEPVYSQEMERARQNVLGQFERRNVEEFGRQTQELERSIAERGLDPAGEAARALRKQVTERQDLARQEALSAAENAAQGVQQQMYGQATGTALLPQQIASGFLDPYMQSQQQQFAGQQGDLAFERQKQLAAQRQKYDLETLAKTPRGGGGAAPPPDYMGQYLLGTLAQGYNQQPQVNPFAAAAQGGTAAFANVFGQNLGRKKGS
jgi:hypothetical protein